MAVRDVMRGEQAATAIRAQHPRAKLTVMQCDLASLASVRHFVESFKQTGRRCHVLLANAGIMACPFGRTVDGHELQFGTNHLGHFALVQQLLPVLRATAQECGEHARVVVVSSAAHFAPYPEKQGGPVRLHSIDSEHSYHPFRAYVSPSGTAAEQSLQHDAAPHPLQPPLRGLLLSCTKKCTFSRLCQSPFSNRWHKHVHGPVTAADVTSTVSCSQGSAAEL